MSGLLLRAAAAAAALACAAGAPAQGLIDLVPRQEFTDPNGVDLAASVYRHHGLDVDSIVRAGLDLTG